MIFKTMVNFQLCELWIGHVALPEVNPVSIFLSQIQYTCKSSKLRFKEPYLWHRSWIVLLQDLFGLILMELLCSS